MTFLSPTPARLGVVCLARLTFEADLAAAWYKQALSALGALDGVEIAAVETLVIEQPDAAAAVADLQSRRIDALVLVSGTFALGGLAQQFASAFDLPIMLWAWPEPAEQTGKLRLNSLVGAHVNASNLYKLGRRPQTLYGAADDPQSLAAVGRFARTAGLARDLRRLRIGLIGGHAPGFDNLAVNKTALRRALGVEVVEVGLQALIAKAKSAPAKPQKAARAEVPGVFDDTSEVTPQQADLFASLVLGLQSLAADNGFDALALKCWGDLAEAYGIAGCGAVAVLNNSGLVVGCEGDVMGAITTLVAQRLCGTPAFLSDIASVERADNTGFFWHIGCAPLCLAAPGRPKHLYSHFAGGKGLSAGFALKPGRLTVLRFGDDGRGNLRCIAASGEALETEMTIRGTVSRVRFDGSAGKLLDELLSNGWEHHLALAYGEIIPDLELLCRALNIPLTVVN